MYYTPTSSSWMNLVGSEKSFASTRELAEAIITYLAARR
jgi:hypothetical protein